MAAPALDFRRSTAYLQGKFVPFNEAKVSIGSSPVLYGLSVYTVFSAYWNPKHRQLYIFRLADHYRRLCESCQIMGFPSFSDIFSYPQFERKVMQLLRRNDVREDVLIRASVFVDELLAGTRIDGLKTDFSMYVYPLGQLLASRGVNVGVSSWGKPGDNSIPPRAKVNGSYAAASLIKNEALMNGYDDAIILDGQGHVTESTVSNVFVVRRGEIITPDGTHDILEGITRTSIFEIAAKLGINCRTATVDRTELYIADEVFLSGSSARIVPVLSVDRRRVGSGNMGPITRQIGQSYDEIQRGMRPDFHHWLTRAGASGLN